MNKNKKNSFVAAFVYIGIIQFIIFSFFFLCRGVLLIMNSSYIDVINETDGYILFSLGIIKRSLVFDNIVISWFSLIPLFALSLFSVFKTINKRVLVFANIYYAIVCFFIFSISIANIPYFQYFFKYIDLSVLNWAKDTSLIFSMIIEERTYLWFICLFAIIFGLFIFFLKRISQYTLQLALNKTKVGTKHLAIVCITLPAFIYGISKETTLKSVANYTYYPFINQLIINPLLYMYEASKETSLINPKEAVTEVEKYLGFKIQDKEYFKKSNEAIVNLDNNEKNTPNVVIVFIESFSSQYLKIKYNGKYIAEDLISKSYYFDNFYSQGTHTNQAIVSTLYGFPSILNKKMLINSMRLDNIRFEKNEDDADFNFSNSVNIYHGLPQDLKQYNYNNVFFMTHHSKFEGLGYFLSNNGFDLFFGEENYDKNKIVSDWGVSDKSLYNFSLQKMDSLHLLQQPFFTAILTIGNHPPYIFPDEFKSVSSKMDESAMAYADANLNLFLSKASEKEWYKNTIFVILGDHGQVVGDQNYNIPLSYNHVPLIIYSPIFKDVPQVKTQLTGQIDVYPIIMDLLGKKPGFNTFGINTLKQKRNYIHFSTDDKIGSISNTGFLYSYDVTTGAQYLYNMHATDKDKYKNIIYTYGQKADSMKNYSLSMIEASRYMYNNYQKK